MFLGELGGSKACLEQQPVKTYITQGAYLHPDTLKYDGQGTNSHVSF